MEQFFELSDCRNLATESTPTKGSLEGIQGFPLLARELQSIFAAKEPRRWKK